MTRRRQVLLGALAASASGAARAALPAQSAETSVDYEILVGGPQGGRLNRWSKAAAISLRPGLIGGDIAAQSKGALLTRASGGIDGVTAANRLQALVVPDGHTAVMLPGMAAIAYLAADPRVHFQIGTWVPVLAGIGSALLVVRGGVARLNLPVPLRFAADSPESGDLAGLLALARLGVPVAPLFGLRGMDAQARAFAARQADAVLVYGENVAAAAAALAAWGGVAICSLTTAGENGVISRDAAFPASPAVDELSAMRRAPPLPPALNAAFHAAVAAVLIDFVLVLPHLTAPAAIALWRNAAVTAVTAPAMLAAADASGISLGAGPAAEVALTPLGLGANDLLALQSWLASRFNWRPS